MTCNFPDVAEFSVYCLKTYLLLPFSQVFALKISFSLAVAAVLKTALSIPPAWVQYSYKSYKSLLQNLFFTDSQRNY